MLDEELKHGIRNQSPRAYEILIDEYSKLLWVVASGVLKGIGSQEDMEDCVAESFAYLWEHPEKYDEKRGSIKTYSCLITKSKAIDKVRKINRTKTLTYDDELNIETDDIGELLINKEIINEVYEFAQNLKQLDREAFILRYFYQLKPREIAAKLNITVKEVSNKLYYSKKSLLTHVRK
ncbi:MAG: sigma-70 family RNA polymerase sigma factor [Anaeromicrobium sp.]|jgi:RNA polymerase sigma-70 factor (ECF subfamily)|uniref:sigma-70 family RNA polymerase sigma factor n=1 Tax=Anaeromicrobium sp. TaxID=1929132 RepID=UPI0025F58C50|nr:sigma-70 family RNA polymerase sigma factor [Anaeromicrobium sp.]MCT4595466.1 sigma-70 family RNA polymerase sigma factor [Anaeromicrobium sp.]